MKHKKRSKKKMLSTFTASAILTTSLLPGVQMVHAEEKVAQEKQVQSSGFQTIDGKTYYFGQKNDGTGLAEGEKAIWTVNINGKSHYFSGDGSAWAANSWLADYNQDGKPNTWYILEKGEMASGFKQIDGKWYYFDPNNDYRMASSWQQIDGKWYYLSKKGDGLSSLVEGEMATGWQQINGKWYYLSKKGDGLSSLVEGEMATGWQQINGKWYYLSKKGDGLSSLVEGEMATGFQRIDGKIYYLSKKGDGLSSLTEGEMATGFQTIDGKQYYFGKKDDGTGLGGGHMATGSRMIDGKAHYFNDNGIDEKRAFAGFQTIDGKQYYFGKKDDGTGLAEGQQASGFQTINGETYYFDPNNDGNMAKDWFQVGEDWYRTNEDGALNKGTLAWDDGNYFFDEKTGKSLGAIRKMGDTYYGYGPGKDATLIHGFYEFDGKKYYFGKKDDGTGLAEGTWATGFQTIDGKQYYFGKKDDGTGLGEGQMATDSFKIGEVHYAAYPNGEMISGWKGWKGWSGIDYYFGKSGDGTRLAEFEMATGFQTIDGKTYYFGKKDDGSGLGEGQMATHWFKIGEDWYRTNNGGALNKGTLTIEPDPFGYFPEDAGDRYFFDKTTGKSLGSIRKMGDTYYGYGPGKDAKLLLQGYQEFNGNAYYFESNGKIHSDLPEGTVGKIERVDGLNNLDAGLPISELGFLINQRVGYHLTSIFADTQSISRTLAGWVNDPDLDYSYFDELEGLIKKSDTYYTAPLSLKYKRLMDFVNDEKNTGQKITFILRFTSPGRIDYSQKFEYIVRSSEIKAIKEEAKQHIESLPNLTETEKDAFKKDVDSAIGKQQVKDIRDKADAKDSENKAKALELDTAKEEAKQHIDSLSNLTEKEKEAFKKDVDSAIGKQQVKDIRDKADAQDAENKDKALEFKTAKEEAKQHIDSLSHLMEVQRQDFQRDVRWAEDKQQVKDIRDKADAKDAENKTKNLAEGILGKTEAIKGFHIGSSELVFLINKKEDVEIERIIVRLPLSEDYETLWIPYTTEKRQKYRDVSMFTTLDNNYYTAPLDTEFLINFFNDENNVGKTLEFEIMLRSYVRSESLFVKKTIGSSLELTKEEAKQHIESLPNLTKTEKDAFKKDVDSAIGKQQVKDIRDKADAQDAENKALNTAKEEAKQHIESLPNLTKTEKDAFKKDVDSAKDKQQVKDIRDKADAQDAENKAKVLELETTKKEAKQHIESLPNLTKTEKDAFKKDVDSAKDKQ
ncbi:hypothetical protein ACIQ48_30085, partial [Bacillus mycoides]